MKFIFVIGLIVFVFVYFKIFDKLIYILNINNWKSLHEKCKSSFGNSKYMSQDEYNANISEIAKEISEINKDICNINCEMNELDNAPSVLENINSLASILNTTHNPKIFFESYNNILNLTDELIAFKSVKFTGQSPKELKRELINQQQPAIRKMIRRYYDDFRCSNESITKFYNTLSAYFSYMDSDNIAYVNKLYSRNQDKISNSYDLERFMIECNAYVVKSERNECNASNYEHTNLTDNLCVHKSYDKMSGIDFEFFCAELLRKNGFNNVEITQSSGDHGADILAEKDGITYAIQCKCYSSNIGNSAVQQAHTSKSIYHKDIAAVMTNQYFTQQAINEANMLGVKLWDRRKINDFISSVDFVK